MCLAILDRARTNVHAYSAKIFTSKFIDVTLDLLSKCEKFNRGGICEKIRLIVILLL